MGYPDNNVLVAEAVVMVEVLVIVPQAVRCSAVLVMVESRFYTPERVVPQRMHHVWVEHGARNILRNGR